MGTHVTTRVAVIGAGKMGLPLACVLASHGARVHVADVNPRVIAQLNAGNAPFDEPGLTDLLKAVVSAGRLDATTDNQAAIAASDVVVVIVPVLLTGDRQADLSIIESITRDCAASLRPGSMVIFETTLPVGTTRRLGALIEAGGLRVGRDFDLVFSPERVKSQFVLRNLSQCPKVVGGGTPEASVRAENFYQQYLKAPVLNVGTLEAAELVKLAGMAYRDVNIALANELAYYAASAGIDFDTVRQAANTDGEAALLVAGIGVGGHCTPVYPHFLINDARLRNIPLRLVEEGRAINDQQPERMVDEFGEIAGATVLILGLAFRPAVKEAAYSPAFSLRDAIERKGAKAVAHDPLYSDEEIRALGFEPAPIAGHSRLVLNTAHAEYATLDFAMLAQRGLRMVVDGRNLWTPRLLQDAGVTYVGVGRPLTSRTEGSAPDVASWRDG